jgi:hypothetical protein
MTCPASLKRTADENFDTTRIFRHCPWHLARVRATFVRTGGGQLELAIAELLVGKIF